MLGLLTVALLVPAAVRAEVKPHALCTDGMVLQQKASVHVWGTADPGETVTVEFRDHKATAKANIDGKWRVTFDSGEAGGPLPMTIAGKTNKLEYKNVLVGKVWVASGQSNMEWPVSRAADAEKKAALEAPTNPMLRMFTVQKNAEPTGVANVNGKWEEADPKTIPGFSAVGYYFGLDLQKALKVPVGIIHTRLGRHRRRGLDAQGQTRRQSRLQVRARELRQGPCCL